MIEIRNIHLKIGNQLLLENESLLIYEGYIHVIKGESGSGKTTLLHEVALLSNLSKSFYNWNGLQVDRLNDEKKAEIRRTRIGYLLQDLELVSEELSLKDNIRCMFKINAQAYNESKVQEYMLNLNLNVSLEQKPQYLSRGERQRFALVLALIKNVDLIICDEPTSALDIENSHELMKYLKIIATKYNKMIIIATHDSIVLDYADIIYRIEDEKLINEKSTEIYKYNFNKKESHHIHPHFYTIYKKIAQKKSKILSKIVYTFMIFVLCIVPVVLNVLLDKQQKLYDLFASHEVIISNTKEILPYSTYDALNEIFNESHINLIREIDHIESVDYYWEINGNTKNSCHFLVVPKKDIESIEVSGSLSNKLKNEKMLYLNLDIYDNTYSFYTEIKEYKIKDYPKDKVLKKEIMYMPLSMMNDLLKNQGIEKSSSLFIYCDEIRNIESTMKEIQKWLPNVTISSRSVEFKNQIKLLESLRNYIIIIRVVLIIGIIVVVYMVQLLENKSRKREITHLRINGIHKKHFYSLYFYENISSMIFTLISCILGYLFVAVIFQISISLINIIQFIIEVFFYIVTTRLLPIMMTVENLFKKDISSLLRE